jgi:RNA polymerase sigma factor (sigma-70 family)
MGTVLLSLAGVVFGSDSNDDAGAHSRIAGGHTHEKVDTLRAEKAIESLVVRIRDGESVALGVLMQSYYNPLLRFATTLVVSQDLADDIVHEVFVRLWNARARLDPQRSVRTYLFTAVRHRALDQHKHDRARRRLAERVSELQLETQVPPETEGTDDTTEGRGRLDALSNAVAALPERSRTALMLRFEQEMTHAEVGVVLGLSEKAAQQVVLRTIAKLRALFATS